MKNLRIWARKNKAQVSPANSAAIILNVMEINQIGKRFCMLRGSYEMFK